MKKYLTLSNGFFLIVLVFLVTTRLPIFLSNFAKQGVSIVAKDYELIEKTITSRVITFPSSPRTIALFWATWCAPCKLEMARLSSSVEKGKIPKGAIIAINPFESSDTVRHFLKDQTYPFTFIKDEGISQQLGINTTPTTLFIEKNKVKSLTSGLSLFGIWSAENFLK